MPPAGNMEWTWKDMTMSKTEIQLDRDNAVAILTLNRPAKRNALTVGMAEDISKICDQIDRDAGIGALVVRGAGGSFCAGADRSVLNEVSGDPTRGDHFQMLGAIYQCFARIGSLAVPVIAAVRGAAVGAGLNLLLAADIRLISENARLLSGFLAIGIHPGGGHFRLITRLAGRETAAAMAICSEEISGTRAVEIGLAWQALPDDQVEAKAVEMAHKAAKDPALSRFAVRSLRHLSEIPWDVALEAETSAQMWSLRRRPSTL